LENKNTYLEIAERIFNDKNYLKINFLTLKYILENNQFTHIITSLFKKVPLDKITKIKQTLRNKTARVSKIKLYLSKQYIGWQGREVSYFSHRLHFAQD